MFVSTAVIEILGLYSHISNMFLGVSINAMIEVCEVTGPCMPSLSAMG